MLLVVVVEVQNYKENNKLYLVTYFKEDSLVINIQLKNFEVDKILKND